MDAERERIEAARHRNLEYIRRQSALDTLDEQQAAREAEELLASVASEFVTSSGDGKASAAVGKAFTKAARSSNSSVYVTGLTTYMACRQLEAMCGKIGKVRRVKFYKDDRGGLKGDAVVTFHSYAAMLRAIERLDGFEIKPGVVITASAADFSKKQSATATAQSIGQDQEQVITTGRIIGDHDGDPKESFIDSTDPAPAGSTPVLEQSGLQLRDAPSRSLVLEHVWDPLAPQEDTSFFDDLEEDMRSECAKYGVVEHIHIVADGSVLVRFAEPSSAIQCQKVMDGRWFDGRQIVACFDNARSQEPDDADFKLEAFLADLDS